jgi:methylmalonyl-CoA mutase
LYFSTFFVTIDQRCHSTITFSSAFLLILKNRRKKKKRIFLKMLRLSKRFVSSSRKRWLEGAEKELRGKRTVESLNWETPEGIEVQALYTGESKIFDDADGSTVVKPVAPEYPGQFPYTRGPYATMYTNRPWTVRQYAGFSTAEESNAFYRQNLAAGQQGM